MKNTSAGAQRSASLPGQQTAARPVLIVGYGNPLRGDDGLGWYAVEQLAETVDQDCVTILERHQLTPELAEDISRAALVIFVDARCDGTPGDMRCEALAPGQPSSDSFSHQVDPPALLAYASKLYGARPEAVLFSVTGESFGYETQLSETARAAVPGLLSRIHDLLERQ